MLDIESGKSFGVDQTTTCGVLQKALVKTD